MHAVIPPDDKGLSCLAIAVLAVVCAVVIILAFPERAHDERRVTPMTADSPVPYVP